jgi:hypothetical protein
MQSNDSLRLECFSRAEQKHSLGQRQNSGRDQIFEKYRRKNKNKEEEEMSKNETCEGRTCNLTHCFNGERRD